MYFKPYYLGCLAQASYLIAGDNGEAAVIDPRRDVEEYLADAEAAGLRIRHVIETHLHADFVSGHVELAQRTGATIHVGANARAEFPHHAIHDGDTIEMGSLTLRFLETPGHTPGDLCIVAEPQDETEPRRVFTGDTLFIGDVGRPDLAGGLGYTSEQMAHMMYRSLREKVLALPDDLEVWPAHGAGSLCGKNLSSDRVSTIGRERAQNPALQFVLSGDEEGFVRDATEGQPIAPIYFPYDARKNRAGASTIAEVIGAARALSPAEVEALSENGMLVLDTRAVADFGSGHVPGAIHVQLDGKFAPWVGVVIAPETQVILVPLPSREVETMTRLARIGYEQIVGWLEGGMDAWHAVGGEVVATTQMSASELHSRIEAGSAPHVLDVRTPGEWEDGHVAGSTLIPLPALQERLAEAPADPVAVICGSGYRSSIACSILQRSGRRDVANVVGGWEAWQALPKREPVSVA